MEDVDPRWTSVRDLEVILAKLEGVKIEATTYQQSWTWATYHLMATDGTHITVAIDRTAPRLEATLVPYTPELAGHRHRRTTRSRPRLRRWILEARPGRASRRDRARARARRSRAAWGPGDHRPQRPGLRVRFHLHRWPRTQPLRSPESRCRTACKERLSRRAVRLDF